MNQELKVTDTQNILNHTYNTFELSSYALTYEATPIYTPTQNSHSFLDLKINIIHEDEYYLVVDKPPSMIVHTGGGYHYNTLMGVLFFDYNKNL